jgi:hypothetical protein
MRTFIQLHDANWPECLNAVQDRLRRHDRVQAVHLDTSHGCILVDHDHGEPEAIVDLLRRYLHGWQVAGNGEIVQVPETPELVHVCRATTTAERASTPRSSELGGEAPCWAHQLDDLDLRTPASPGSTRPE